MIEQTNELVRSFNSIYKTDILVEVEALVPRVARLPGLDGSAKMSKSLGNALFLSNPADIVIKKVMSMYTDPLHLKVADPGRVRGKSGIYLLDVFDNNPEEVALLKERYRQGGLGDVVLKKRLYNSS